MLMSFLFLSLTCYITAQSKSACAYTGRRSEELPAIGTQSKTHIYGCLCVRLLYLNWCVYCVCVFVRCVPPSQGNLTKLLNECVYVCVCVYICNLYKRWHTQSWKLHYLTTYTHMHHTFAYRTKQLPDRKLYDQIIWFYQFVMPHTPFSNLVYVCGCKSVYSHMCILLQRIFIYQIVCSSISKNLSYLFLQLTPLQLL